MALEFCPCIWSMEYGALTFGVVMNLLDEDGFIPEHFVDGETKVFYNSLGIDGRRNAISSFVRVDMLTYLQICTSSLSRS